jgi:predicted DNA binding CopG/RHH family protein
MMAKLDPEEQEILSSVEAGEWLPVVDKNKELKRFQEYARATFRTDQRVNVRITGKDLEAIKKRALLEGIPYQTLIASVLHKYVSGRLKEEPAG